MLKDIRLHVENDEASQEELERQLASAMANNHKSNINAFRRNIPSLIHLVQNVYSQNISIFCNKNGEINIVDYGSGRVLYGLYPQDEIRQQVAIFSTHSVFIDLAKVSGDIRDGCHNQHPLFTQIPNLKQVLTYKKLPTKVDCLVVLGCGLGLHLKELLEKCAPKHLIIYEPELQYFSASILSIDWNEIFNLARLANTNIYFQIGKDGRDLLEDIEQLRSVDSLSGFYLFQHYNHPIFNNITSQLRTEGYAKLTANGLEFRTKDEPNSYSPPFPPVCQFDKYQELDTQSSLFKKNLTTFQSYFPDIYQRFKDFTPTRWQPVMTHFNQVNLINAETLNGFCSDKPKQDCSANFAGFCDFPNKDGLELAYNGEKLAHYFHYQFVDETQRFFSDIENKLVSLPDEIKSIILFGIGVGYQLEELFDKHQIDNIFLCEPNSDFFFASLYAIDWTEIIEKINAQNARLYINIGDDGTHLFNDLLKQFYTIGPYILNNTYFYQHYYNAHLNLAIAQLREKLKIVVAMGEYFDHAFYGINHTLEVLDRGPRILTKNPGNTLSFDEKSVPVFLVGNGPSLDISIDAIKEWQDKAIIVSCGTCLKVLYKNGIKPDFHAEIEQNRATRDWALSLGEPDYLKSITLISCNGIHPETCDLFKDVLLVFKEGESSTVSTLAIMGENNFESLQFAFPTVSNLACNLFTRLNFNDIYLIGIDLGFTNAKHHHSTQSDYYKASGEESLDFKKNNNVSLKIPGNFRPTVYTKYEFKLAKDLIEQAINDANNSTLFFNCSDGAKINKATPLRLENILLTNTANQKQAALQTLKFKSFVANKNLEFSNTYLSQYKTENLIKFIGLLKDNIEDCEASFDSAEGLINFQKNILVDAYRSNNSLFFFYFHGTINYANAILSKIIYSNSEEDILDKNICQYQRIWTKHLGQMANLITTKHIYSGLDNSSGNDLSINTLIRLRCLNKKVLIISNSNNFFRAFLWGEAHYDFMADLDISYAHIGAILPNNQYDFVIYHLDSTLSDEKEYDSYVCGKSINTFGQNGTLITVPEYLGIKGIRKLTQLNKGISVMPFIDDRACDNWAGNCIFIAGRVYQVFCDAGKFPVILNVYQTIENSETKDIEEKTEEFIEQFSTQLYFRRPKLIGLEYEDIAKNTNYKAKTLVDSYPEKYKPEYICQSRAANLDSLKQSYSIQIYKDTTQSV